MPVDKKRISALAKRINETSNADFVKRLLDAKRKTLKNADGTVSTHELGYVTEGNDAVVFPSVQSVGDSLARFPYPESYERAVEMGDTVHMNIPDAELFTKGYKEVYPGFKQYGPGGWIKKLARDAKNAARRVISKEARLAESYSSKEYTFDEAYKDARSKGQKTFFWNGDYYNTDYEGEHGRQYKRDVASGKAAAFQAAYPGYTNPELRKEKQEELDTYGITNEQTQNKSFLHERALNNLDFYGDYDWKQAVDALVLNNAQREESDTSPKNLTHYQQLRFYLGYPLLAQDTGRARSGLNGYGAPVKISAFRPTTGTNSTPYYYTFLRNPYGNEGLAAGSIREKYDKLKKESEDYLKEDFYKDAEKYGLEYAVQIADKNTKKWDDYFDKHVDDLVTFTRLENFIPATYRGKFESRDWGNASGLGNFTQYGTPEYRSFYDLWDIGLGQGNKTLTFGFGRPFEYYDRRYHDDETKQNIPNPDIDSLYSNFDYSVGGLLQRFNKGGSIHIKQSHRGRLTELKARTGKTEAELYNDGNPAHKKMVVFARNSRKWHADGGLLVDAPADIEYANKWDRISNARYTMANNALLRSGSSKMDADRLARFLAAQSALEAGWTDESKGNNYAGYMNNGKRMSFDTVDSFWDYHIKNLDERWPAWRDAQTIDDYYNTVNSTALGLTTKEAFNEYNRKHRDAPAYIYAPDWENENYLGKLQSVYNKYISKYVKPMFDAGGFIQKHGRDKILAAMSKMKQSK